MNYSSNSDDSNVALTAAFKELELLRQRLSELEIECQMLRQAADYFYRENLRLTQSLEEQALPSLQPNLPPQEN